MQSPVSAASKNLYVEKERTVKNVRTPMLGPTHTKKDTVGHVSGLEGPHKIYCRVLWNKIVKDIEIMLPKHHTLLQFCISVWWSLASPLSFAYIFYAVQTAEVNIPSVTNTRFTGELRMMGKFEKQMDKALTEAGFCLPLESSLTGSVMTNLLSPSLTDSSFADN